MTKYFEYQDIKILLPRKSIPAKEEFLNAFQEAADSFENIHERDLYIQLVKDIAEKISSRYYGEEFTRNITYWLIENKDLNDIASLYQMTTDLAENGFVKSELTYDFAEETGINSLDYWLELADKDLKENKMAGNIKLAYDLKKIKSRFARLSKTGKPEAVEDIDQEFKDWLSQKKIKDLISNYSYDLDDYLEENEVLTL
ncbi:hypothetical protein NQV05_02160 [Mycoplasmopsis agalactiae]|uniref:Mbov_0392 family ICE element protein n=1 Tax=Mycoplasmopsis agalactiae TaxID=2110 RepID=UPI00211BF333|nr:hypothetical protein [Mycoplasmopsis agalactiae]UUM25187.1 hypothetical protein NQV05_02160 [Mycoplasmopsis agalactiae]